MPNLYEILGVSKSASQEELQKAYRSALLISHPDKHHSNLESRDTEAKFLEVHAAWQVNQWCSFHCIEKFMIQPPWWFVEKALDSHSSFKTNIFSH